ncbi:MAG TPA: cation:dicarboxylase symporter family transporter [Thermotogota bacterium]|nr:cation:dicarboxylase symporter family transporter [Thermotogota bacterium]
MQKRIVLIIMWSTLVLLSVFSQGFAGLDAIEASGRLRILMVEDDWWPFFYVDESGDLAGIDVELAGEICAGLGVSPEFIRKGSFNQLASALKSGEGDIIISYFSYTPQRNMDVFLTDEYINSGDSVLINNQLLEKMKRTYYDISPENIIRFLNEEKTSVATVRNTAQEIWIDEVFPNAEARFYDQSEIKKVLESKGCDAFYFDEIWTKFFLTANPELYLNYTFFKLLKNDKIVIAVSPENLSLYLWLDKFLSTEFDINSTINELYEKYSLNLDTYLSGMDRNSGIPGTPWNYIVLALLLFLAFLVIFTTQKKHEKKGKKSHWLLNFWTVIFSMIIGLYCGAAFPVMIEFLSPLGDLFFNYLLLCGIPILFCVVLINFVRLMMKMGGVKFFTKFIGVILLLFLLGSFIGLTIGVIVKPGEGLSTENRQKLAVAMNENTDEELSDYSEMNLGAMLWSLPKTMIPDSIFKSFSENRTLAILFFAILLAFALKKQQKEKRENVIGVIETLNGLFMHLFNYSYYLLPFGLFSLMLSQAKLFVEDASIISAFLLFTVCQFIIVGIWFLIALAIGCVSNRINPIAYIRMIRRPMIILFSLLSTLAAIPAVIEVSETNEKYNDETIKGTLPLIMVMLVPSIASMFALTTIFLVQLTGLKIAFFQYLFILLGAVGATLATTGVPAPIYLYAMSIVVSPFGIPVSQAIFFMLPWTLTGVRLETINFTMLDFGVVHFFKGKNTEEGEGELMISDR